MGRRARGALAVRILGALRAMAAGRNDRAAAWYYAQGWADHERLVCQRQHHQ